MHEWNCQGNDPEIIMGSILGKPSLLLGMKISQHKNLKVFTLSQTQYILSELDYKMQIPLQLQLIWINVNLEFDDEDNDQASDTYAKVIGSPMYAAIRTQPNIGFAVHTLAKFTRSPQPKHVFHYLKGIYTHTVTYCHIPIFWHSNPAVFLWYVCSIFCRIPRRRITRSRYRVGIQAE